MRRSTPGMGDAFQSSVAACTTARFVKSALRFMVLAPYSLDEQPTTPRRGDPYQRDSPYIVKQHSMCFSEIDRSTVRTYQETSFPFPVIACKFFKIVMAWRDRGTR